MIRLSARRLIGVRHTLGHELIDAGNAAISDCWLRAAHCDPIELPFQTARLRKLMRIQFDRETALIEAIEEELCWCHRREHQALMGLCDEAHDLSGHAWKRAQAVARRLRKAVPEPCRVHGSGHGGYDQCRLAGRSHLKAPVIGADTGGRSGSPCAAV